MSDDAIPRQYGAGFDERRNSSRVFPVSPEALGEAMRALRALDPRIRRWIEDGHPNLTDSDHVQRFGETYKATRSRKATPPQ